MRSKATIREFVLSKYIYALVFVAGVVAFLYPLISSTINYQAQTRVISNYQADVKTLDKATVNKMIKDAQTYNKYVAGLEGNMSDEMTDTERKGTNVVYMSVLSTGEAIGYLEIPKLDINLPIYRGTSDAVLDRGVGHMEKSSLPIGGESTHAVLVGHRGLPTSRLFRDLNLLVVGDQFYINTLGTTIAYQVDTIQIVLPTNVEALRVQEGKDLCTLVTCDPYMINSHRLLVTGHRVAYTPGDDSPQSVEQISFFQKYWEYFVIIGFFVLLWIVIMLIRRRIIKRKERLSGERHERG